MLVVFYLLFNYLCHHEERGTEQDGKYQVSKHILAILFPISLELVTARAPLYFDPLSVFYPNFLLLPST